MELLTASGTIHLEHRTDETVNDAITRYGVPISAVTIILDSTNKKKILSGTELIGDIDGNVLVVANRNIDLGSLALGKTRLAANKSGATTAVLEKDFESGNPFDRVLTLYSSEEVLQIASDQVLASLENIKHLGEATCIIGVSGGGDSNLLLTSMARLLSTSQLEIIPVMVLGLRDWDNQLNVAKQITAKCGFELKTVTEDEGASLAEIDSISQCMRRYETEFPGAPIEYISTWYIRRVLSKIAAELGSRAVVLGGNREDALAEGLYSIARGAQPMPIKMRKIGETYFFNPLCRMPKKVIDAAYPEFSLQNYRNRVVNSDIGRSVFYLLAHLIEDRFPGIDNDLLNGIESISSDKEMSFDVDLQDYIHHGANSYTISKWKRVIGA